MLYSFCIDDCVDLILLTWTGLTVFEVMIKVCNIPRKG